jgi:CzcA family heavy metal efflux pump
MLQAIVAWSLRNRVVVVVLAALLLVAGGVATQRAKLDVFPEFAPPLVVIQTECPGLSPSEVEQLVTTPIETAVNGISGLDLLRSQSIQGLSVVTVIFSDRTDIYRARQQVTERLAVLAGQLPTGVKAPRLEPLTSTTGRLLSLGFTSTKLSPRELRDRVQWNIRPRLLGIQGVAKVALYGGDVRQFQVQIDPDYLAARSLTLTQVLEAARQASSIRGAGFIENNRQRLNLRVEAQVTTAEQLGETAIATVDGSAVRLKDIGRVTEAAEPKFGDALINGKPGVILVVFRQLQADTPQVTARVEEELDKLEPVLKKQGIDYHRALFRQANFIEHAVGNVTHSLVIGAVLVAIVLFVFLFNVRTAFISLTAIPLSLLSAILVLWLLDVGLNTLTLGGLAIAIGEVVDDAIIDVENIFRRLRENAHADEQRSDFAVILAASLEVRNAVVYATFIVVLVFVPIFFLSGLQGRLFAPLGYAYVLAVLASLLVALTVTPALAYLLLPHAGGAEESPILRRLQSGYDWLLRRLDGDWALVLTVTVLLLAAGGWAVCGFGGQFLPELREDHFVVHMRGLPGSSLPQAMAAGAKVTEQVRKHPGVLSVSQQAGRAELGEDTTGVEYSEIEVDLKRLDASERQTVEKLLNGLDQQVPGYGFEAMPFLTERIKETLSGSAAALAIKIFGDDFDKLDATAMEVARLLRTIPGYDKVRIEPQTGAPELVVRVRSEDAGRFGLRNAQILDAVHAAYQGAEVGQVYDRNRIIDMAVILLPAARLDPDTVAGLWLSTGDTGNGRIQLKQVADVYLSNGRFLIGHEGGTRRQVVTCNVKDRDVESFVTEVQKRLAELPLPEGVYVVLSGEHEAKQTAQRELLLWSLAAGIGILLLLWMAFGSLRRLLLILVNLPFALVGGVAAVYIAGGILDVGSLIGFVTLFGITTRNGIMMVSHWQHLHEVEGMSVGPELIFRGARERLAPVLMTALVTGLGLLPIALGSGAAGREIEGPMAQVILGGLITSTALNLLVLPVLYRRLEPLAA